MPRSRRRVTLNLDRRINLRTRQLNQGRRNAARASLKGNEMTSDLAEIEDTLKEFIPADIKGPIHMLNLFKFKENGGEQAYKEYATKMGPLIQKVGGERVYAAIGRHSVYGPEVLDAVSIVQYPSSSAFHDLVTSEEYLALHELRDQIAEDYRLFCIQPT